MEAVIVRSCKSWLFEIIPITFHPWCFGLCRPWYRHLLTSQPSLHKKEGSSKSLLHSFKFILCSMRKTHICVFLRCVSCLHCFLHGSRFYSIIMHPFIHLFHGCLQSALCKRHLSIAELTYGVFILTRCRPFNDLCNWLHLGEKSRFLL